MEPRGKPMMRRLPAALVAVSACVALVLSGCGKKPLIFTGDEESTTVVTAATPQISLPFAIAQAKVINVGSDLTYPPMEALPAGAAAPQGFDIDLGNAIGDKLGVRFAFQNAKFEGLVSSLVGKQYDIVMSAMKDTGDRRDAGVDFVDYLQSGLVMVVAKGNPKKIAAPADLCGKSVAVQKGTAQEDFARSLSEQCGHGVATTTTVKGAKPAPSTTTTTIRKTTGTTAKAGAKGPLAVQAVADDVATFAALKAAKVAAVITELPTAGNTIGAQPAAFDIVGDQIQTVPYGIAVRKDSAQLRDAIAGGLKAVIVDGTYKTLVDKWHLTPGAIADVGINTG